MLEGNTIRRILLLTGFLNCLVLIAIDHHWLTLSCCTAPNQTKLAPIGLIFYVLLAGMEMGLVSKRFHSSLVVAGAVIVLLLVVQGVCPLCRLNAVIVLALTGELFLRKGRAWLLVLPALVLFWAGSGAPNPSLDSLVLSPALRPYLLTWNAGRPDAPEVVVVFDYGCSHCLTLAPQLDRYATENPDHRLKLLYLPVVSRSSLYTRAGNTALEAERAGRFMAVHRQLCRELTDGGQASLPDGSAELPAALLAATQAMGIREVPLFYRDGRQLLNGLGPAPRATARSVRHDGDFMLARTRFAQGDFETAAAIAERVLAEREANGATWDDLRPAHMLIFEANLQLGRREAALRHGRIVLDREPQNKDLAARLRRLGGGS